MDLGTSKIAICCCSSPGNNLYLLFADGIISSAMLVQHRNNKNGLISYISYLDSTGFNRGHTGVFIRSVIKTIPGLIVCFSHPKTEPIFGRSSGNIQKNILEPKELYEFWKAILGSRCDKCSHRTGEHCFLTTWSNFDSRRSFPYRTVDEIEHFEDDPKCKMSRCFESVDDFFDGLLFRTDFNKGALLFSNCLCQNLPDGRIKVFDDVSSDEIVKFLRNRDFSGKSGALESSKELIRMLRAELHYFDDTEQKIRKAEPHNPSNITERIIPRRPRNL